MKRSKKLSVIGLSIVLSLSFATGAMANGKGNAKGLETAPGQSVNFSKGVTTEVVVTDKVTEDVIIDVNTTEESTTEVKSNSYSDQVETVTTEIEFHDNYDRNGHTREVTVTTISLVTTTETWDETTTLATTTTTETPVTITETTETTNQHRGAPGSNGKFFGSDSITITDRVEGETVVVDVNTEKTVTKGEVTTSTTSEVLKTERTPKTGWGK